MAAKDAVAMTAAAMSAFMDSLLEWLGPLDLGSRGINA